MPFSHTSRRLRSVAAILPIAAAALAAIAARPARAANDVLLQTMDGAIVLGSVDDQSFVGTLGARVHSGAFNSSYLTSNPGFFSFSHGNFNMPPGAGGFPSLHDVNFDLLPMTVAQVSANLLYWNGVDLDANGFTAADVDFAPPTGVHWQVLNDNSAWITVDATDSTVNGGRLQRTFSDVDPNDGVDSGSLHKHLAMRVVDAGLGSPPAQGVYMVAWQIRSAGFESSEPLLMLHRTSGASPATLTAAVVWADANYDALTAPPLDGDFDRNGQVDGNDFLTWQRTLGTPEATDLGEWRQAMAGGTMGVAAILVPEPASLGLMAMLLGSLGFALLRKGA